MTQKGYLNVKNHGACLGTHLKLVGSSQEQCTIFGKKLKKSKKIHFCACAKSCSDFFQNLTRNAPPLDTHHTKI